MAWLQSYGCATAAGDSSAALWEALLEGRDFSRAWPQKPELKTFPFQNRGEESISDLLLDKLLSSYRPVRASVRRELALGVILASTKGMNEDFIRDPANAGHAADPLTPLLRAFLKSAELNPKRSLCVSNACSSALAALSLAESWMEQGIEQVLILAADCATRFVIDGFQALKLISPTGVRPFSGDRNGFFLGDGAACLLVTRERRESDLRLHPVGLDSEGSAVTRPTSSGVSLRAAALRIPELLKLAPEILIGHGTGTVINDETEDLAFSELFPEGRRPFVTATKWCVGHTLGASGAVDLIAAAEALRARKIFRLMTTDAPDPRFRMPYLTRGATAPENFTRVMISSLGFGGMHASALLERTAP